MAAISQHQHQRAPQGPASSAGAAASASADDLDVELLAKVLQHVPLKQRHGSAALVGSAWHQAAAVATASLDLVCDSDQQCALLVQWVTHRGSPHLTCISLQGGVYFLHDLTVNCKQLRSLSIKSARVWQVPASMEHLGCLTRLCLSDVILPQGTLSLLSGLTNLREGRVGYHFGLLQLPYGPQRSLPLLTRLELPTSGAGMATFQALPNLQELSLLRFESETLVAPGAGGLYAQLVEPGQRSVAPAPEPSDQLLMYLRRLSVGDGSSCRFADPWLSRLTALQDLEVMDPLSTIHARLLPSCDSLTRLHLACRPRVILAGTAELLQLLGRLTNLQHLSVMVDAFDGSAFNLPPWDITAYSALTASSQLRSLQVHGWAPPHALPAGAHLPRLTTLMLALRHYPRMDWQSCCPALRKLHLGIIDAEAATSLAQLRHLEALQCTLTHTQAVMELAAVSSLSSLTALLLQQSNTASHCQWRSDMLRACATLRGLQRCHLSLPNVADVMVSNKAPRGTAPDVWEQLCWVADALATL